MHLGLKNENFLCSHDPLNCLKSAMSLIEERVAVKPVPEALERWLADYFRWQCIPYPYGGRKERMLIGLYTSEKLKKPGFVYLGFGFRWPQVA